MSQTLLADLGIYNAVNPSYEPPMSLPAAPCTVPFRRFRTSLVVGTVSWFALLLSGCSGATAPRRADGTYLLDCSDQKACLQRAKRTCGEEGYLIVGGKSNKKRYGAPGNEVFIGKEEMYIRCNRDRPTDSPDLVHAGEWSLPKHDDASPSASAVPATNETKAKPAKSEVCRPGETQRCVGPGACEGGQACLMDGSAFGPCDCGQGTPKAPTPGAAAPHEAAGGDSTH